MGTGLLNPVSCPSDLSMFFSHMLLLLFSHHVMSDSLWSHGLYGPWNCPGSNTGWGQEKTRTQLSNKCLLSQWWRPTISFSVIPFSSCPQSFPASGSFPVIRLLASGGQSIGASASALPMNSQGWFPLGLTGLIFLLFKRLSRVSSRTAIGKYQFCWIWNKTELETTENPMGFRLSLKSKRESHWIG